MKPSKCLSLRENADTTKRVSAPPAINEPGGVIARIENSFLTEDQKRKVLSQNLLKKVQQTS